MKIVHFSFVLCWLGWSGVFAQTTHPLLLQMQELAQKVDYGSYRIVAREQYPYSKDTVEYRGDCAFSRFEHLDGKPGIRFDVQMETHYPGQINHNRTVFDGFYKYDFRSDTMVMLYDSRELGDEYVMRGLQYFFFVPLLLHPGEVQKFLGPDKYLGTPPYQTLDDTLVNGVSCHWVGADWSLDTAGAITEHIRFGLSKTTGLPVYFSQVEETRPEQNNAPLQRRTLQISVENWSSALPVNSFYVDWPSLPATYEVRHFHDCYHKDLLRSRDLPGL